MKQKILPYLLLAPMMLIMGVLVFYPIAATFSYSLKKWKLTAPGDIRFIGFDNYKNILKSESFWYQFAEHLVSSGARGGGNFGFGSARVCSF